jgi:hypothetical protein
MLFNFKVISTVVMVDDLHVMATALQFLAIFVNILSSVHIPVLSGSIELLEEETHLRLNNEINHTLLTANLLLESFCKLLFLTTTCPQANIPRAHIEGVVFPNFVRSAFNGGDVFSESEQCQHLFWNLTGERVESFLQIVRNVGPTLYAQTRRGHRRQMNYLYVLDMRNRILLIVIWQRCILKLPFSVVCL